MSLTNSSTQYGGITKTLHWLTALLILTLIPLGIYANDLPYETSEQLTQKALVFSLHKTLGVTVFFVALARISWAISQPKPGSLHPDRRVESALAQTVHWLLYGSLLLVPLSGWVHHAATSGFAPIWWPFGQNLPFVPKSTGLADLSAGLHIVFERVLVVSLGLHVLGALKHHFVDRDVTLKRMWFGRPDVPEMPAQTHSAAPLLTALVVWIAALGAGSALGLYSHSGTETQVAQLEEISSEWQVQEGTLAITVRQLGSEVSGQFAAWTADISFDENTTPGDQAGEVTVTVSIGSLTLGSSTEQAMGPDFFDAETFPTAVFDAQITALDDDRYEATGTLTIKDQTMPLTLPFVLTMSDGTATMTSEVNLDRRDFGIGDSMTDAASLGFDVAVIVDLVATRTE